MKTICYKVKPTRTKRTEENHYNILENGKKTHESQLT